MSDPINDLRAQLRASRQSLTSQDRRAFSETIAAKLGEFPPFKQAKRVAFYASTPEEVDTAPAIQMALDLKKEVFLPVINGSGVKDSVLLFARYEGEATQMNTNRFGIPEPDYPIEACTPGSELDLVCVPLVGFNSEGHRIGMGGGYYDRTFEKINVNQKVTSVFLAGLAFGCQQADFDARAHDVPLNAVITEQTIWQI